MIEHHGRLPDDVAEALLAYLDAHRADVRARLGELAPSDLTVSRVPSGWSPLGLLNHLVHMERRWLEWRFLGLDLPDVWGDGNDVVGAPWLDDVPLDELLERLDAGGRRTREIVAAHGLDARGRRRGSSPEDEPATLQAILLHVSDEYARHLGHLDVAVELARG
ncbi:DUF664 domain-containing protein [Aeromicrobium sp. IC_218]|uniref:mycothiol transferase n=1 Tax=Aeromicrobium sp. IC_218 TaxID=2545468 RepID=UPI00103E7752|nr:DUF664 domain-containing protein [Aeromicrobium sp. IC_218]TCI99708.1 DUF664 domain-containing protein [Aeromicrobium sp. IC_218]